MTLTEQQALERLCNYINLNFKTQKEAASSFKVSDQFMSAVLTGKKRMTKAMMGRLNITRRMVYLEPTSRANTDAAPVQPMKQDHIAEADKMVAEPVQKAKYLFPLSDAAAKEATEHLISIAEPVKQEPVAWRNAIKHWAFDCAWNDLTERQIDDLELLVIGVLNAAPVDFKAIRAAALEEAEEIAKTIGGSFAEEFLAAIRSLK